MKIKMNWKYAKGEFDTDTVKMLCIPARGKRAFGSDEEDSSLCIKDGMNFAIAEIHTGDVDSSNALCEEIARRWNEFEEWHEFKSWYDGAEYGEHCIFRYEAFDNGNVISDYITAVWSDITCDYLNERISEYFEEYKITHWKPINKPKGVEK